MTPTPLEKTTEPVGGVPAAVQHPAAPPEAVESAVAVIKPWQIAVAVMVVVIAVLGFLWQMQDGLNGIREEVRDGDASIRLELDGIRQEIAEVRRLQIQIVDRLSRVEGFLGVGLPDDVAERAPGAGWAGSARGQDEE